MLVHRGEGAVLEETRDLLKARRIASVIEKAFENPSKRMGYIVGPEVLMEKLVTLTVNAFSCTPEFVQRAGIAALTGPREHLLEMEVTFRKRRDAIVSGLNTIPGFSCKMPEGAFYAWPNITGTGLTSQDLATLLLQKAGIACLPGTDFGEGGEGYMRFSHATSLETISEAIDCILRASTGWNS